MNEKQIFKGLQSDLMDYRATAIEAIEEMERTYLKILEAIFLYLEDKEAFIKKYGK